MNCFDFIEFPANTVEDLHQSKTFYGNVFGWSYQDWGDDYATYTTGNGDRDARR